MFLKSKGADTAFKKNDPVLLTKERDFFASRGKNDVEDNNNDDDNGNNNDNGDSNTSKEK